MPGLSVAENIVLGHEPAPVRVQPARGPRRTRPGRCCAGWATPRSRRGRELGRLSAAGQQIVSMARALSRDARLIVMDEPSAVLDADEVDNLFRVVRELTAAGVAVVYISHRLEEIRRIGDRVTVLKDGRTVARNLPAPRTPDRRGHPADDRPGHRVRLPRPRADADRATSSSRSTASAGAASSPTCRSPCGPARSSAWPGWSGPGRSEILETVYGARRADRGHRRGSAGKSCRPGRCRRRCGPGWGWRPRSARARAC